MNRGRMYLYVVLSLSEGSSSTQTSKINSLRKSSSDSEVQIDSSSGIRGVYVPNVRGIVGPAIQNDRCTLSMRSEMNYQRNSLEALDQRVRMVQGNLSLEGG